MNDGCVLYLAVVRSPEGDVISLPYLDRKGRPTALVQAILDGLAARGVDLRDVGASIERSIASELAHRGAA